MFQVQGSFRKTKARRKTKDLPTEVFPFPNDLRILGMVKRDTITDIKDSVGNILGVNKDESLLEYIEDEIDTQLDVDVSIETYFLISR